MNKNIANIIFKRTVQLIIVIIAVAIVGRAGTVLFHAADIITLSMSSPNSTIMPGDTIKLEIKFSSIHDILDLRFFVKYPHDKVEYVRYQKNESLGADDTVDVRKETDNIRDIWVGLKIQKDPLRYARLSSRSRTMCSMVMISGLYMNKEKMSPTDRLRISD